MAKASEISLDKAKADKLFYVIANVAVYRESDHRCLLLKRADTETVHPGIYAMPGGKLEWADLDLSKPTRMNGDVIDFENTLLRLIQREAKEEAGIEIGDQMIFINDVAYVRTDGVPCLLVKFAAPYKGGEVVLEDGSFTGYVWVNSEEAKAIPCIEGIPDELRKVEELLGT